MVFSSPYFLFVFLPVVIFLIAIGRTKLHNFILLCASLYFYAWGGISQTPIFIFSILANYVFGRQISRSKGRRSKAWLSFAVVVNLLLLGYFKYFNFLIENINDIRTISGSKPLNVAHVVLPIGISFFTFHALSYVIDVYRHKVTAQKNLLDLALYISFFPQLIAGPIVRYIDVSDQFRHRVLSLEKASAGVQRFIFGFAKKVIVANTMAYLADQIFGTPSEQLSTGAAWLGALAYAFQIYFDFSGYSDMAIGLAKVFGFDFPENFNYPYVSQSIKEFWRHWHISLSIWFRDFLYIPLGGNRKSEMRTIFNLLFVFFCTGFWHGASWNFIFWGMFHGMFLLIERTPFSNLLEKTWKPLRIAYTFLVVIVGWVFFRADTLHDAFLFLRRMSTGNSVHTQVFFIEFIDAKIIFMFVFATLYSFRVFRWLQEKVQQWFNNHSRVNLFDAVFISGKFVISTGLLFISISYLAASTYNPFIYFRF